MHELSLCVSLVDVVAASARREGVSRVTRVVLEVGAAATVDPEALRFAFPIVAAGGALDGSELVIERIPLRLQCGVCGVEYSPDAPMAPCPSCGAHARKVLRGRELRVVSFDGA
jgi:hydrogenase nickel incorporation protein HypA/HybF